VVCIENCSLRFHSLGIRNEYEGNPVFQGIFNMFQCVGSRHVFP